MLSAFDQDAFIVLRFRFGFWEAGRFSLFLADGVGKGLERVNFLWMGLAGFFRGGLGSGKTLLIMESSYDNALAPSNCNNCFFFQELCYYR